MTFSHLVDRARADLTTRYGETFSVIDQTFSPTALLIPHYVEYFSRVHWEASSWIEADFLDPATVGDENSFDEWAEEIGRSDLVEIASEDGRAIGLSQDPADRGVYTLDFDAPAPVVWKAAPGFAQYVEWSTVLRFLHLSFSESDALLLAAEVVKDPRIEINDWYGKIDAARGSEL
jgi:hypothetical protein